MDKTLRRESKEEKENVRKILVNSRMSEIWYSETFNLIFRREVENGSNEMLFSLIIDAPCWFGNRTEWESKVKDVSIKGGEDCCLASELVRLRYNNLIYVQAVEFYDEYFQIVFSGENTLSISNYSNSDDSWVIDEVSDKMEADRISVSCQDNVFFQNNMTRFLLRIGDNE